MQTNLAALALLLPIIRAYQDAALEAEAVVFAVDSEADASIARRRMLDLRFAADALATAYAQCASLPHRCTPVGVVEWLRYSHLAALGATRQTRNAAWLKRVLHDMEWRLGFAGAGMNDESGLPESLDLQEESATDGSDCRADGGA